MYSRTFSDKPHPPPEYGGTVLSQNAEGGCDDRHKPPHCQPPEEECRRPCEPCGDEHHAPPPHGRGLLSNLLPFDIKGDDRSEAHV